MCFRPSDASTAAGPMECPECGKPIMPMGGIVLKTCPFCKADFEKYMNADGTPNADAIAADQAGKGGAPKAPAAPGAPKPPSAPGAPKAPGN